MFLSLSARPRRHVYPTLFRLETRLAPATIPVTNASDSGSGSLRQAILNASSAAYPGVDDIVFDAAYFASPRTVSLLTAMPDLNQDVNFKGTSAANVTITRALSADEFRIFNVNITFPAVGNVSFADMTITRGVGEYTSGGGIFASNDNVKVTRCVLTGNESDSGAGGIATSIPAGVITISDSTISGNFGHGDSAGGGGVFIGGGTLLMSNCTVTGNTTSGLLSFTDIGGAGIYIRNCTATIRNSTISGNSASGG